MASNRSRSKQTLIKELKLNKNISTAEALTLNGANVKSLTRKELSKLVSTMSSAANKRRKRMEQAGQPIGETVERFSVAGKSRNELLKEFTRVRNFMNAENQSLSGQKRIRESVNEALNKINEPASRSERAANKRFFNNQETYDKFWRAYENLKDFDKKITEKQYKYRLLEDMKQYMMKNPDATVEQVTSMMITRRTTVYEDYQKETNTRTRDAFTISR